MDISYLCGGEWGCGGVQLSGKRANERRDGAELSKCEGGLFSLQISPYRFHFQCLSFCGFTFII